MRKTCLNISTAVLLLTACHSSADQDVEFNTPVLKSTVKLISGSVVGTGFLVTPTNLSGRIVLVSAAHVLTNMGERVTVIFRGKTGDVYQRFPVDISLRTNAVSVVVAHTNADVAAFVLSMTLPPAVIPLNTLLGDFENDSFFRDFSYHPGDEVRVIGFPRGYEYNAGFPVLRSGRLASYPLWPARQVGHYLIDFPVFPGNSGGPVFVSERRHLRQGEINSVTVRRLIGLVSQSVQSSEQISSQTELVIRTQSLGLGLVVPAEFIQDVFKEIAERLSRK